MKIVYSTMANMLKELKGRKLVCFGGGQLLHEFCFCGSDDNLIDNIAYVIDNDVNKQGKPLSVGGRLLEVYSLEQAVMRWEKNKYRIVITAMDSTGIITQMNQYTVLEDEECLLYTLLNNALDDYILPARTYINKIPKKIHYCWFGGGSIPTRLPEFIAGWKKYCPDYEIIKWDESNYDVQKNKYLRKAYQDRKWAFVSDFARLDIIYNEGGVYLDTDVEVIKNLDDLLENEAFCGFFNTRYIATGLGFGAIKGYELLHKIMESYLAENVLRNVEQGLYLTNNKIETSCLLHYGLKCNNSLQDIEGMRIYPTDVLNPKNYYTGKLTITPNTHTIHHYEAAWFSYEENRQKTDRWKQSLI